MRLAGGTGAIISALASDLQEVSIRVDARVMSVVLRGPEIAIGYIDASGAERSVRAAHVVLALPPRLLQATVTLSPAPDGYCPALTRDAYMDGAACEVLRAV